MFLEFGFQFQKATPGLFTDKFLNPSVLIGIMILIIKNTLVPINPPRPYRSGGLPYILKFPEKGTLCIFKYSGLSLSEDKT